MQLKPGSRLVSAVCDTEVVVVKAPAAEVDLRCGGSPMLPKGESAPRTEVDEGYSGGTLIGKRYADEELGLEVLCTKAGAGSLSVGAAELFQKDAKPLPSSD
jgi:hypothetical protein